MDKKTINELIILVTVLVLSDFVMLFYRWWNQTLQEPPIEFLQFFTARMTILPVVVNTAAAIIATATSNVTQH
ncbi:hypothetical protein [Serratia sp. BFP-2025]|uniref:hypothetical protein n=1 Tax=Serratia sp. BFP-2025 TaxID=3433707 RepID=UPI003D7E40EF